MTLKASKLILAVALVSFLGLAFLELSQPSYASANPETATNIGKVATTTGSFAVTSSTRILATTTNARGDGTSYTRVYATICNPNANPVYLALDGDQPASVANATYVIAAAAGYSACYEITDRNLYMGSVQASSTGQTSTTIFVSDYVQ
jgi:hypothetical protein